MYLAQIFAAIMKVYCCLESDVKAMGRATSEESLDERVLNCKLNFD